MEELEEKNEQLQDEVAELKDEIERLKNEKGSGGGGGTKVNESMRGEDAALIKDELH